MTWVRIDDQAPNHPKLIRAGAEAAWLWQAALCYSNAHKLDGRIYKDLLPALYAPLAAKVTKLSKRLCEVGLWHDRGDHFELHDYDHYQGEALKEEVESRLDARREHERIRKRKQRERQKGASRSVPDCPGQARDTSGTDVPDNTDNPSGTCPANVPSRVGAPPGPRAPARVPSRPVPTRSPTGRSAREDFPEPDPDGSLSTRGTLVRGYRDRYESKRNTAWMSASKYRVAFDAAASWCEAQAERGGVDPVAVAERLLDGLFADPWATERDWPPSLLESQPGRLYDPPGKAPDEPLPESPEHAEIARLHDLIDAAEGRGDFAESTKLRSRQRELAAEIRGRKSA